jgi:hypothetical protein
MKLAEAPGAIPRSWIQKDPLNLIELLSAVPNGKPDT